MIVTHNAGVAGIADRVVRFHDGAIGAISRNEEKRPARELVW